MNRRRNALIVLAGLAAVIVLGFVMAGRPKGTAVAVTETTVTYTHFTTRLPETGVVQRPQTVTLAALVPGNLGSLYVRPGQHVTAGALVATIVNPQLESNAETAQSAMIAAQARARSIAQTNAALPSQNQSSIVQAAAAVQQARSALTQAQQDVSAGAQSGLGYGGTTAEEQRVLADANVAKADTDLAEARRIYLANQDLYANKAISKDTLDQSQAKYSQAQVADEQARRQRDITYRQLVRTRPVLVDRVVAAQNQVRQAEAQLAAARDAAQNTKVGDLQAAQADALARAQDYEYARAQLARTQLRAPFGGIVQTIAASPGDNLRQIQPGDAITAGQSIATIAAGDRFIVKVKVDEQDVAAVRLGQRAHVSGEDLGTRSLNGRVVDISPSAQKSDDPSNTSRQIITTVLLDRSLPFLRDGMTVDVDLTTLDLPHVLAIPSDAIRRDANRKPYVYVVTDGHAKRVNVRTGASNEAQTVVLTGLHPGDRIVSDKSATVSDGLAVRPAPSPSASGAARGSS